jgi:hypothetical protein
MELSYPLLGHGLAVAALAHSALLRSLASKRGPQIRKLTSDKLAALCNFFLLVHMSEGAADAKTTPQ